MPMCRSKDAYRHLYAHVLDHVNSPSPHGHARVDAYVNLQDSDKEPQGCPHTGVTECDP